MRLKVLIIAILVSCSAFGQDTILVKHLYYKSVFINSEHIPLLVEYNLTKEMLDCKDRLPRARFSPDPSVDGTHLADDYKGSGYDCGHNMSAEDNACSEIGEQQCFYYTNMFPQTPKLNRGVWKALENHERDLAMQYGKITIFIGSIGIADKIGEDQIFVPGKCWKAIYISSTGEWFYYCFPNNDTVSGDYSDFQAGGQDLSIIKKLIKLYY